MPCPPQTTLHHRQSATSGNFPSAVVAAGNRFARHPHLLDMVIEYADSYTRTVLLRLSREWYEQVGKLIYRTVTVDQDTIEGVFAGAKHGYSRSATPDDEDERPVEEISNATSPHLVRRHNFKAALLAHVHTLVISTHDMAQCRPLLVVSGLLPSLKVVKLVPHFKDFFTSHRGLCDAEQTCPLTMQFKAPKVVFSNVKANGLPFGQTSGWKAEGVKELVVCLNRSGQFVGDYRQGLVLDCRVVFHGVERVTFIFKDDELTRFDEDEWLLVVRVDVRDFAPIETNDMIHHLERVMRNSDAKFEVIGLETVPFADSDEGRPRECVDKVQRALRDELGYYADDKLVFVPMAEWVKQRENTEGVLTDDEVDGIKGLIDPSTLRRRGVIESSGG